MKILRRILGPAKERGTWERRKNTKLYKLFRDAAIVLVVILSRLGWAGHIIRNEGSDVSRRITDPKLSTTMKVGKPNLMWLDGARNILGIGNLKAAAINSVEEV